MNAFDEREIEIMVREKPTMLIMGGGGNDQIDPARFDAREPDAREASSAQDYRGLGLQILREEETDKLIDHDRLGEWPSSGPRRRASSSSGDRQDRGGDRGNTGDVSRQGVQRDPS